MSVEVQFFNTGYCTYPEMIAIRGGQRKACKFYATFALIKHPKIGNILFDTGYSNRFYSATTHFPFNLYALITPVFHKDSESALNQLAKKGITIRDIKFIIISHFHADHICGLRDFSKAIFLSLNAAYENIRNKKGLLALKEGFIPELLPDDFNQRFQSIDNYPLIDLEREYFPFTTGYDIAGDRTIIAVPLEGHAKGHLGLLVRTERCVYFLIGDACWLSKSYQEFIGPHPLANLLISNKKSFLGTLNKIYVLYLNNSKIKIIPTHCPEVLKTIIKD